MNANLANILGIEALCAAQGVEFRAPLATSPALAKVVATLRERVPPIDTDRYLADDLQRAAELIASGALADAAGIASMAEPAAAASPSTPTENPPA